MILSSPQLDHNPSMKFRNPDNVTCKKEKVNKQNYNMTENIHTHTQINRLSHPPHQNNIVKIQLQVASVFNFVSIVYTDTLSNFN